MDPERQWISRLEPETPHEEEEIDESPLGRVPRLIAAATVPIGGTLGLLGYFREDLELLRVAALGVVAIGIALTELIRRRRTRLAES